MYIVGVAAANFCVKSVLMLVGHCGYLDIAADPTVLVFVSVHILALFRVPLLLRGKVPFASVVSALDLFVLCNAPNSILIGVWDTFER